MEKLVRDRIPEIIEAAGETPEYRELGPDEYRQALRAKLREEVAELLAADDGHAVEEVADVVEVLRALVVELGRSWDDVEGLRQEKSTERGAFDRRLMLTMRE